MRILIKIIFLFFFFASISSIGQINSEEYYLEIIKSEHKIYIKKNDEVIKKYRCSIGRGIKKGDKNIVGDNKTPIGDYRVVGFNKVSKYHFFIHLNYPNIEDAERALKNKIITNLEFEKIKKANGNNKIPPQKTKLGGYIGIHGVKKGYEFLGSFHKFKDWTQGCIAVNNKEIMEIRNYCKIGTKVLIKDEKKYKND